MLVVVRDNNNIWGQHINKLLELLCNEITNYTWQHQIVVVIIFYLIPAGHGGDSMVSAKVNINL